MKSAVIAQLKYLALSVASCQMLVATPLVADDSFGAATFREPGEFTWQRPDHVRWILLEACGGGGGGGAARVRFDRSVYQVGGHGGNASDHSTLVVGPLLMDSYSVQIGSGGGGGSYNHPGQQGRATIFSGGDRTISFHGGSGGPKRVSRGEAVDGSPSFFATGGRKGDASRGWPMTGGSGGRAGLGVGGNGGGVSNINGLAGGACAGGGGAANPSGAIHGVGGPGGVGFLRIIPILDADFHMRAAGDSL